MMSTASPFKKKFNFAITLVDEYKIPILQELLTTRINLYIFYI